MRENLTQIVSKRHRGLVLNYGPPKTGKTRSIYTLWKMGLKPIWNFCFDGPDSSAPVVRKLMAEKAPEDDFIQFRYNPPQGNRVGIGLFTSHSEGKDAYLQFVADFNKLYDMLDTKTGEYRDPLVAPKVVVFDSWTALQDLTLDFIIANVGHELGSQGTDARSDFGKQMKKIQEVVDSCKELPSLFVFNAHEKLTQNELTSEVRLDPLVTGQLAQHIAKDFGVVLHSVTRAQGQEVVYKWEVRPKGNVKSAGTRHSESLPPEIEQDYAKVL